MAPSVRQILAMPAPKAAALVVGMHLEVEGVGGRIVEAEAYTEEDEASHCYGGPRGRNLPMFLAAGHLYVYRSYGVHWCLNLVTGPKGRGEVILVRALEPLTGIETMRSRRPGVADKRLCAGPGNLTKALAISDEDNAAKIGGRLVLTLGESGQMDLIAGPRIGLTRALDTPWRFRAAKNRFVSRP